MTELCDVVIVAGKKKSLLFGIRAIMAVRCRYFMCRHGSALQVSLFVVMAVRFRYLCLCCHGSALQVFYVFSWQCAAGIFVCVVNCHDVITEHELLINLLHYPEYFKSYW